MKEYIEREALDEDFERCNANNPHWTPQRVKNLIFRQSSANVVEVRHGHWKLEYDAIINQVFCVCSECGGGSFAQSDYCPNCGAKMDGGAE